MPITRGDKKLIGDKKIAKILAFSNFKSVRIRQIPSLAGNVVGTIPRGSQICYTEMVKNSDGIWLKLDTEERKIYTTDYRPTLQVDFFKI